ncbi:oxidoreductase [Streptomyces sp. SDT5-1]|uniref:oxidoreductase n=1 Tax=Streptomyces sp. SDT5-1 TaxID=3406418 RepID=UPI003FD189B7
MNGSNWTADRIPDLAGKTFVVTGANSGLGLATTRHAARRGAHVVMAVRNETKGRKAAAEIRKNHPGASLEVRHIDLVDLDSVRAFAAGLHADGVEVDVLINNAGVMAAPRQLSPQGHESQFAGNHLGHFALTGLLLDLLQASSDPRVVTVTSIGHHGGKIFFDDLTGARKYEPVAYYDQSKFANAVFGLELDRRLRAASSPVRSLLAHPGVSATNLQSTGPSGLIRVGGLFVKHLFAQHVERGVLPQLYAATSPDARGGELYGPDGWKEFRGHPTTVAPDAGAEDLDTARRLWNVSEELTGVYFTLAASS